MYAECYICSAVSVAVICRLSCLDGQQTSEGPEHAGWCLIRNYGVSAPNLIRYSLKTLCNTEEDSCPCHSGRRFAELPALPFGKSDGFQEAGFRI